MNFILASNSPRRKELLGMIVHSFDVIPSETSETLREGLNVYEQATYLSYIKAKDVYDRTTGDRIVIGSDTMVVKNNKIFGKPKNEEDAKHMIKELLEGDKTHSIITGLSILISENGEYKEYKTFDKAKVFLKDISDEEIDKWIKTGKAMDKAGAYGIQNEFCVFVEKIEGNYTSIVGIPIHKVYDIIKKYID